MKTPPIFTGVRPAKTVEPAPPPVPPGLMNMTTAAEWLVVSQRFLAEEVRLQRIRCVRMGKLIRFDPKDLVAYAEARKVGGLAPVVPSKDAVRGPTGAGEP